MGYFESCCTKILENEAEGASEIEKDLDIHLALGALNDINTTPYIVTMDGITPLIKRANTVCYADIFMQEDEAVQAAKSETNCISAIMIDYRNRLKNLYRNGVNLLIVHLDKDTAVGLPIDTQWYKEVFEPADEPARPALKAIINMLDYAVEIRDSEKLQMLYAMMYDEFYGGPLLAFRNKMTGEILRGKNIQMDASGAREDAILVYTDIESMIDSVGARMAAEKYGRQGYESIALNVEDYALPPSNLLLNEKYVIRHEAVSSVLLITEHAKRALLYVKKKNEENGITLDGEDLLVRLSAYPDMYREFVTNISEDLTFTGKITARAAGYSGAVLMKTTTHGNAAAAYSLMEKLTTNPDLYRRQFETGKITY